MNINLNLYKYFYEVAKYESFTKAAEINMISQPSLSYSVKVLEEQLGVKLFRRIGNKVVLTDKGREIYYELDEIFKRFSKITNGSSNAISGKITLGVRSAYANSVLPFYINELNKIYPDLQIGFYVASSKFLIRMLKEADVDLIIDEISYDGNMKSIKKNNLSKLILFANKKVDLEKNDIYNSSIYAVEKNKVVQNFKLMNKNVKIKPVESTSILIEKVKNDNIIGLSPYLLIKKELDSGEFVEIKSDFKYPDIEIYATYISNNENDNIKAFIDFFETHYPYD